MRSVSVVMMTIELRRAHYTDDDFSSYKETSHWKLHVH